MKYIIWILVLLPILLLSCSSFNINDVNKRDRPKFDFVLQLMENPEKIEEICKNVNGFSINYFNEFYFDNLKNKVEFLNFIIPLLNEYKKAGYKIHCEYKQELTDNKAKIYYWHCIIVEGSGIDELLKFRWDLNNREWIFINIDVTADHGCGKF